MVKYLNKSSFERTNRYKQSAIDNPTLTAVRTRRIPLVFPFYSSAPDDVLKIGKFSKYSISVINQVFQYTLLGSLRK